MKIFLIAGEEYPFISAYLIKQKKVSIVNKGALMLNGAVEYLSSSTPQFDKIVVTDGGLSASPDENAYNLAALAEAVSVEILVVTRDFLFGASYGSIKVIVSKWFRASKDDFNAIFEKSAVLTPQKTFGALKESAEAFTEEPPAGVRKKFSFNIGRRLKQPIDNDGKTDISLAASKAIVFTGHRGSGVTSTAVNTAWAASRCGVNTVLVDLDVDYRSVNLYFGEFYKQAEEEEDIASSLVRMLAQPQSYQTTAVNVEKGLWVTALGYDFNDKRLLEQHFTESKIIGLITSLKHSFDLVAIDFPLDGLAQVPNVLNSVDALALCIENNIYSALTTLRNIVIGYDERERISYFASKARLVVTKYNDESAYDDEIITPDRLSELIVSEGFCEDFTVEMPVAGSVPYVNWFGRQIERDISVIDMDSRMKQSYDSILLRLLGGAK